MSPCWIKSGSSRIRPSSLGHGAHVAQGGGGLGQDRLGVDEARGGEEGHGLEAAEGVPLQDVRGRFPGGRGSPTSVNSYPKTTFPASFMAAAKRLVVRRFALEGAEGEVEADDARPRAESFSMSGTYSLRGQAGGPKRLMLFSSTGDDGDLRARPVGCRAADCQRSSEDEVGPAHQGNDLAAYANEGDETHRDGRPHAQPPTCDGRVVEELARSFTHVSGGPARMLAEPWTRGQRTSPPSGTLPPHVRVLGFVRLAQRESRSHERYRCLGCLSPLRRARGPRDRRLRGLRPGPDPLFSHPRHRSPSGHLSWLRPHRESHPGPARANAVYLRGDAGRIALIKLAQGIEIAQRYRIVGILGRGGMGTVYRALDRELSRDVAVKVLRSEIAQQKTALERFKREIQLSSQITHRNVLRVYDLGAHETLRFLTMQHVEGEDLASLVRREGRLPISRWYPSSGRSPWASRPPMRSG